MFLNSKKTLHKIFTAVNKDMVLIILVSTVEGISVAAVNRRRRLCGKRNMPVGIMTKLNVCLVTSQDYIGGLGSED